MSEISKIKVGGDLYNIVDSTVDQKLKHYSKDYTAFEVLATDTDIEAGTLIKDVPQFAEDITDEEVLAAKVRETILACKGAHFIIKSSHKKDEIDVIVDWGDGTFEKLSDLSDDKIIGTNYHMFHMYENAGKYIIKIYGKKYWGFRTEYSENNQLKTDGYDNLLYKILEKDLPVASHLTNYSGLCSKSLRLIMLKMWSYSNFQIYAKHVDNLFCYSKNMVKAIGFNDTCNSWTQVSNTFVGCSSLIYTDFILPRMMVSDGPADFCNGCFNLKKDITEFFPNGFVLDRPGRARSMFVSCQKLYGDVSKIAKYLWDSEYPWNLPTSSTQLPFLGCSDEIRAQVPVSWGGTNKLIDAEIQLRKLNVDFTDYTAFEVFAHDYDIPVGECEELGGYVYEVIPAGMTHKFLLRCHTPKEKQNTIIDWGDGEISDLSLIDPSNSITSSSYSVIYQLSHTYKESGKYIIKLYGSTYEHIMYDEESEDGKLCNLISRAFAFDLPIASHINTFDSTFNYAKHLININISENSSKFLEQVVNTVNMFAHCTNLTNVIGFNNYNNITLCSQMFLSCINLVKTDFRLPSNVVQANSCFQGCENLDISISKLLPSYGFTNTIIGFSLVFRNMKKLKGTITEKHANYLWNNKHVYWEDVNTVFSGCSDEIRAQVPVSWGGTASDDIIEKSLEEKYSELLAKVEALEGQLSGVNTELGEI